MEEKIFHLTISQWLAIIGAFAWLPSIFQWIKDYLKRVKLVTVSGKELEIGYTSSGPILNLKLAYLSENKKSLIKSIELILVHERNDTQKFSWEWFEEQLYTFDLPNTDKMHTRKNQEAIAINIDADDLVEKKIGFQQDNFKQKLLELELQLREDHIDYLKQKKPLGELKLTKAYREMHNLFSDNFIWKTGNYKIKIKTYVLNIAAPFEHDIEFELKNSDLKILTSNLEILEKLKDFTYIDDSIKIPSTWNWASINKNQ